ncbi:hypothetical protein [Pseudactinotalea suaedae]|uniref:hypothetical protein n=1 Tax=Pseudactinotalea suaedae TaxID=1524924 RepID=UPI0012E2EFDF|nr:hypothetical protein [Pseudactinotalea suaedae]
MTVVGEALKVDGQERSVAGLDPEVINAFMDLVARVPAGERVSVNDLRGALDEIGVPERSRGGLFAKAVKEGLLVPLEVQVAGRIFPARIPSTGVSAHNATVRVYERPTAGVLW